MGEIFPEGVEKGVGTSNPILGGELTSLMSNMMADLRRELKESQVSILGDLKELKESQVSILGDLEWKELRANQTSLHEKIMALKETRASRSVTPKCDHIHRNTSGGERVVARGERGYGVHVSNRNVMNCDGRYGDYKCYGGYNRLKHDRGDYESRYRDDGLDRGSRRERVSRLLEEPLRRRNGEYNHHKGYRGQLRRMFYVERGEDLAPDMVIVATLKVTFHHGRRTHLILSFPRRVSLSYWRSNSSMWFEVKK